MQRGVQNVCQERAYLLLTQNFLSNESNFSSQRKGYLPCFMILAKFKIQNKNIIFKCQNIFLIVRMNYFDLSFNLFICLLLCFVKPFQSRKLQPQTLISRKLLLINLVFSTETSLFCESKDSFLPLDLFFLSSRLLILVLFFPQKFSCAPITSISLKVLLTFKLKRSFLK